MINVSNVNSKQSITSKASTYNAVSIKINEPRVNVNKNINNDENLYNAVNMEINHPSIENKEDCKYCPTYDYPNHNDAITTEFAPIHPITVPSLPLPSAAYQTAGFIDSIFILESDKNEDINKNDTNNSTFNNVNNKIEEEAISVPEPNFTNIENEKSPISLNFKGLNFKSGVHSNLEIIPPEEIKPEINVNEIVENLSSTDFDKQALQMEAIAKIAMNDPEKAIPYIVTEIFTELINIAQKDTSNLKSPSEKQMEIREQIIINEIVKEQAKSEGKDIKEIGLPFDIDKKDLEDAIKLSPMELAERNKLYGNTR